MDTRAALAIALLLSLSPTVPAAAAAPGPAGPPDPNPPECRSYGVGSACISVGLTGTHLGCAPTSPNQTTCQYRFDWTVRGRSAPLPAPVTWQERLGNTTGGCLAWPSCGTSGTTGVRNITVPPGGFANVTQVVTGHVGLPLPGALHLSFVAQQRSVTLDFRG